MWAQTLSSTLLFSLLTFTFTLLSCSDSSDSLSDASSEQEAEEMEQVAVAEDVFEDLDELYEQLDLEVEASELMKGNEEKSSTRLPNLASCATRTIVVEGNSRNVTIDFGEGCEGPQGRVLQGKIHIDMEFFPGEERVTSLQTFEDFYVDSRKITGAVTRSRSRATEESGRTQQIERDVNILFEDGSLIEIDGQRSRTQIEGMDTIAWGDNVWMVEGNWTVRRDGALKRSFETLETLRREAACRFYVSGRIEHQGNRGTVQIDFGDGQCDDLATMTIGENTFEIHLRRKF